MQEGAPEKALAAIASLDEHRRSAEADYVAAVCYRLLGNTDAAIAALATVRELSPASGRAWQEEGHVWRDAGDLERALTAYQKATAVNPWLIASWRELATLFEATSEPRMASRARLEVERLSGLPRELLAVASYMQEGRLLKAERLCRDWLVRHPRHVEGMRLLADLATRHEVLDEAEFLLASALATEPDHIQCRIDYMRVLRRRQKLAEALEQARLLYARDPGNPVFQSNLGVESQLAGDTETALMMFDAVLDRIPNDTTTLLSKGHALKTIGRAQEAIKNYRAAYRTRVDCGNAWWSLANLKTYRFTDEEIADMRRAESQADIKSEDRIQICFALGKAYEDKGDYRASYEYYARGNLLRKKRSRYRADHMDEEMRAQASVCGADLFVSKQGLGNHAPDPIFIVGLPRAGSTLLEQILASHSRVDGTMELPNILALSQLLRGRKRITERSRYPRILQDLNGDQLAELGSAYLAETRILRGNAPRFVDKMPNNFRHLALIALILPRAKIIDARRGAMACCFSGFKQLFAQGQEFTYSLDDIGRYYRGYVDLMDHWDRALPGRVLRVYHEDVVADLDGQVRRMLEFCELPFEQACLDFYATERPVRTASSEQVRRPLSRESLEHWRHFEQWLGPLKQALGPLCDGRSLDTSEELG